MIGLIAVAVLSLGAGFGAGRVKNLTKLSNIKAEVVKVENSAIAEVKTLVAAIKVHLGI
jgi:hypothetical protein